MPIRTILLAEDDPIQRRMVRRILEQEPRIEIIEAEDGAEVLRHLKSESGPKISLILLDLQMPIMDGMSVLRQAQSLMPKPPIIVLTGSERMEDAVEAIQLGALDFLSKPPQRERLLTSVRNALAMRDLQREVRRLQQDRTAHYRFSDIVEISPGLREMAALGRKAAGSEIPVLITGESGVGKEVFARAVHQESNRSGKAFIPVNCGALPDNLVESTLFGHEKGSFTGAIAKSIGKCREADGGVLFLDEVGELKLDTQVKLLRMLQQGEIEPVGSGKPLKVDVRVISATNRPLEQLVAQGRFREDLYYRLQGLPLHIPALRERKSDIAPLAEYLLQRVALAEKRLNVKLSDDALEWLTSYGWPGNVRELQHVLARAMLLTEGNVIKAADLARWVQARSAVAIVQTAAASHTTISLQEANGQLKSLEQIEQEVIEVALARYDDHIGKAAAALGIGQSTLYKRMRKRIA